MNRASEEHFIAGTDHPETGVSRAARRIVSWLLDPPQATPRWGDIETLTLMLWVAIVAFAVWQHVPWADEMQAWFLADAVSWHTLLLHSLRYEGTGGLWHCFLKVCQAAHLSFSAARYLAAGVQAAAVMLLLRYAPLPRAVRLLLPFTFFLLYQDTVIARSYCLLALFAFLAAKRLRAPAPRPISLALLLGLMANISVHGAILSGGLAIVAAVLWGKRLLRNPAAVALLLCLWGVACIAMAPAYDINYEAGNNLRRSFAKAEQALGLHATPPPRITGMTEYGLSPLRPVAQKRDKAHAFRHRVERLLAVITFPLSSYRLPALLLAALVAGLAFLQSPRRNRQENLPVPIGTIGLLPWGLMVLVFSSLFLAPRHAGTVFTGFVVTAWLIWPEAKHLRGKQILYARLTAALLCLLCVQSVAWSARAIAKEHSLPYSPGRTTASFLQTNGAGRAGSDKTVAGFYYFSIDTLLYFNRNIYFNQPPHRYWLWSTTMLNYATAQQVLSRHPDFIVVGGFNLGPDDEITADWFPPDAEPQGVVLDDRAQVVPYFEAHGYRETHLFCGHGWMRGNYGEQICNRILEPVKQIPRL
jgi:hypothetical protein